MYVTLFELLLWFIFVRRRKGITNNNLNSKQPILNWTHLWLILNFIFLNHFVTTISTTNLANSSAFSLNNNSLLDNLIDNNLNNNLPISTISSVNFTNNFLETTNNVNSQKSPTTFTNQSNGPLFRHTFFVSTIFIFAYSIVFIIGLVGNLCVMIVVIRSSRMRNATNFFICNLAFADTLVVVCCLPATLLGHLLVPWILGMFLCKLVSYLQGIAVSASINTLVAVSIERYLAICYPFKRPMSRRKAKKWIFIIWIISLTIAFPWAIYFKTIPYQVQSTVSEQHNNDIKTTMAQKLIQQNKSEFTNNNELNSKIYNQLNNEVNDNQNIDQNTNQNTDQIDKFLKQRINLSILNKLKCKFKKIAELDILNSIHRFIIKLKINFIYKKSISNHKKLMNTIIDFENRTSYFDYIKIYFNKLNNLNTNEQNFNLDYLNEFINYQLNFISCKCINNLNDKKSINLKSLTDLDLMKIENTIDKQLSIQIKLSKHLDRKINNLMNSIKNNESDINSKNNKLTKLNRLEINLLEEIKLIKFKCEFDCDNLLDNFILILLEKLDYSICSFINKNFNQNINNTLNLIDYQIDNQLIDEIKLINEMNNRFKRDGNELNQSYQNNTDQSKLNNYIINDYSYEEICVEAWPNKTLERVYFVIANLILCYLLPLIIISACYICIWVTVWTRSIPCETATGDNTSTINSASLNNTSITNTPITELPHHSCRLNYARKQLDQNSTASSSKSSKSLLVNTFTGLKTILPNSNLKHSTIENRQLNLADDKMIKNQNLIIKLNDSDKGNDICIEDELIEKDDYQNILNDKNKINELKKSNQIKKSLLVCNYKQNQLKKSNNKQQIMITIDSSPTNSTNNSSIPNETPINVCKRIQNKFKIFKKLLPNNRKPIYIYKNKTITEIDNENNQNLKQLIKTDYQIEQIDELDKNLELSDKSRKIKNKPNKIIVKRALSKQSLSASSCVKCSNINNNCECKTHHHHHKQLIKSTKSTPITNNDRLPSSTFTNRNLIDKKTKRTHKLTQLDTSTQLNNRIELILQRSRLKVAKMMIIIILVFFLSWMPLYIIFTKLKLGLQFTSFRDIEERITMLIAPFVQWICYINSCVNPTGRKKCLKKSKSKNRIKKQQQQQQQQQNTSTILKASVKSHHPSISVNHENNCKNYENYKRIVSKSPNNFVLEHPLMKKELNNEIVNSTINRSQSISELELDLKNRKIIKRSSFSGSIN